MFLAKSSVRRFTLLKKMISKKDWQSIITYLETKPNTDEIQPELLDNLMVSLYEARKYSESYKLLALLPSLSKQPTDWHFITVIETSIEANKMPQALNVFYQAQMLEISFDALAYSKLLAGCSRETGGHNIRQIVLKMIKDNSIASPYSLGCALKVAIRLKDYALVELILNAMSKGKYVLPKKMVAKFVVKNNSENTEFESLKNYWNNLATVDDEREIESDKEKEKKVENKEPYTFGFYLLPGNNKKDPVIEFVTSEDDSSDS